jgi:cytochrome c-type biogenesis protein CcmE
MAQTSVATPPLTATRAPVRIKFLIGGLVIIAAIILLIATTLQSTAQYFYTVNEIVAQSSGLAGQNLRASGAVLGETITYDSETLTITFEMANVPTDEEVIAAQGGLANVLHNAVLDPNATRIKVVVRNQPMPDLLKNEAQAIVTGKLGEDGVFYADELLLKCPTRYDEAVPAQVESGK